MQKEIFNDVLFQPEAVDIRLLLGPLESNKVKRTNESLSRPFYSGTAANAPRCGAGGKEQMPAGGGDGYAWNWLSHNAGDPFHSDHSTTEASYATISSD